MAAGKKKQQAGADTSFMDGILRVRAEEARNKRINAVLEDLKSRRMVVIDKTGERKEVKPVHLNNAIKTLERHAR